MARKMRREDFEDWLEDHRGEALDYIEDAPRTVEQWVRIYAKALKAEAAGAEQDEEEDEDAEPALFA
jgi:hypothetical protein